MQKKYLIKFLQEKKKGAYGLLVQAYQELLSSMPIVMAVEIIREDLKKEAGEVIEVNYFSVVRAFGRFKKKNPQSSKSKQIQFKDAHELSDVQFSPGRFKIK